MKKVPAIPVYLLLSLFVILTNCKSDSTNSGFYQKAYQSFSNQEYDSVFYYLDKIPDDHQNTKLLGNVNYLRGYTYYTLDKSRLALRYYKSALYYYRENNQIELKQNAAQSVASIYFQALLYDSAIHYYQLANLDNPKNARDLAMTYQKAGEKDLAIDYYFRSLEKYQELKDPEGLARVYNDLGILYYELDMMPLSLRNYQKAYSLAREINDGHLTAQTVNNIGNGYLKMSDTLNALNYFERALALGDEFVSISTCRRLADISYSFGNIDKSIVYYNKVVKSRKETDYEEVMHSLTALIRAYSIKNNTNKVVQCTMKMDSIHGLLLRNKNILLVENEKYLLEKQYAQKMSTMLQKKYNKGLTDLLIYIVTGSILFFLLSFIIYRKYIRNTRWKLDILRQENRDVKNAISEFLNIS